MQRALLQYYKQENHDIVLKALKEAGRFDLIGSGRDCLVKDNVKKKNEVKIYKNTLMKNEEKRSGTKRENKKKR